MVNRFVRLFVAPPIVLATLLGSSPSDAIDLLPDFGVFKSDDEETKQIWSLDDQFVRIEHQDHREGDEVTPNDHPVELSAVQISDVLGAIEIWEKSNFLTGRQDKIPVFVASELRILGRTLAEGLAQATPEEDVTFAVIGVHGATFTKEPKATAGRVFYQAGTLNLIFGDLHESAEFGQRTDVRGLDIDVDRRLHPFHVGSREKARGRSWRIIQREGLSFASAGGVSRGDWLVMDMDAVMAGLKKEKVPAEIADERERMHLEVLSTGAERRRMRAEMARFRKALREGHIDAGSASKTVEERLLLLEELRKKKLISDGEYALKRKEILDDL